MLRTYVLLSGLILSSICIQCQSLWLEDELTSSTYLPFDTYAADLDQDGDLDVLSASKVDNKIAWYEKTAVISDLPEWRVLLYDLQGKLIRSEQQASNNEQLILERGKLSSGSYVLRVISEDKRIEIPFIAE